MPLSMPLLHHLHRLKQWHLLLIVSKKLALLLQLFQGVRQAIQMEYHAIGAIMEKQLHPNDAHSKARTVCMSPVIVSRSRAHTCAVASILPSRRPFEKFLVLIIVISHY